MRAYQLSEFGLDNLHIVDRETPRPGDDQVLIRFHAASLNYRDVMIVNGTYNPRMKLPVVPVSDGAGEIVEVGKQLLMTRGALTTFSIAAWMRRS